MNNIEFLVSGLKIVHPVNVLETGAGLVKLYMKVNKDCTTNTNLAMFPFFLFVWHLSGIFFSSKPAVAVPVPAL